MYHMLVHTVELSYGSVTSPCIQLLCENNTASIQPLSVHQQSGEHMAFLTLLCSLSLYHISFSLSLSVSYSIPIHLQQEMLCEH